MYPLAWNAPAYQIDFCSTRSAKQARVRKISYLLATQFDLIFTSYEVGCTECVSLVDSKLSGEGVQ